VHFILKISFEISIWGRTTWPHERPIFLEGAEGLLLKYMSFRKQVTRTRVNWQVKHQFWSGLVRTGRAQGLILRIKTKSYLFEETDLELDFGFHLQSVWNRNEDNSNLFFEKQSQILLYSKEQPNTGSLVEMHMVSSYSSTFTKWLLNWHFDFHSNACHTLILMAPLGMVILMASPDFRAEYFPQIQHHASCWSGGGPTKSQGKRPCLF
jgi:hypothetical protein